jgi:hypothetical protein
MSVQPDQPATRRQSRLVVWLCWVQGLYFFVFGLWPLVSIETFQAVTGKKTDNAPTGLEVDHWLVNCVGVLVAAIGLVFLFAALRKRASIDAAVLAVASCLGLTAIDVIYVARGVILPIYLGDAMFEAAFVVLWLVCLRDVQRDDV